MNQPQFVQAAGPNALKIIISGSYKKVGDGEIIDFDNVEIIMPLVAEEYAIAAARKRYAYSAIKATLDKDGAQKYQKPIEKIRDVHIDDIQEIEHSFEYVGKGIKEMSEEDLQHLAVEKGLREIPLPRRQSGLSMREIRQQAYVIFAERVLGWKIDMNDPAQNNYSKWNDVIPNPMQKAKPVEQKTAEQMFDQTTKEEEKLSTQSTAPQHVTPEPPPVSTAPHMANPDAPVVQEPQAQVVHTPEPVAPMPQPVAEIPQPEPAPAPAPAVPAPTPSDPDELSRLQTLALNNGIEYDWDATEEELKVKLSNHGIVS